MTEVLVVLFVTAVLTGLSFAALLNVRTTGRSAACLNRLRQMTLGATQYALEFDHFPAAIRYERRDGALRRVAWDWVTTLDGDAVEPGAIWRYMGDPGKIQQCPEYDGPSNFNGDPHTGYNYNTTYLGGEAPFPSTGWENYRFGISYGACTRTSSCALFGDGGWRGGANKFMRAPENTENLPWSVIYAGGQAFRHRGSTNLAYIDGHVGHVAVARSGVKATETLLTRIMGFPRNGFLSDDDRAYKPR